MLKNLFKLDPERVKHDSFWESISRRNLWLIKMRYFAVALLLLLTIGLFVIKQITITFSFQPSPLIIISLFIIIYNIILARIGQKLKARWEQIRERKIYERQYRFHDLHFSLIQMSLDFISLLLFIHFTGGVETPLFVFFIFHVIIGSLILPGPVIYLMVSLIYIFTALVAYLEYNGILPHYSLEIYNFNLYNNETYLFIYFTVFGIGLFLSTYLANSIAKELYIRESKLSKTLKELEEAEKTKSRYVMSIVHDLKTPIAAASTYLNMLLEGTLGEIVPAQKQPLERSKYRLGNAINTINDILNISQLKIESSIEDIADVNLIEIFNEIYTETRILILNKELDYKLNASNNESIFVQAEPKLLKLAFANLVSNAIKYSEPNGKVYIKITELRENVEITVMDNGIGIPENEQAKIFTSFFRSSLSKQKEIEGTGLGLSLVKEVIEKYNGSIHLKSPSDIQSEGRPGTEFIVTIPKQFKRL